MNFFSLPLSGALDSIIYRHKKAIVYLYTPAESFPPSSYHAVSVECSRTIREQHLVQFTNGIRPPPYYFVLLSSS